MSKVDLNDEVWRGIFAKLQITLARECGRMLDVKAIIGLSALR